MAVFAGCSSETAGRDPASISAQERSDGQDKDGERAQLPTNIAGAFLVSPDMRSCLNEVKDTDQSLVSMCGVVLNAEPVAGEQRLSSEFLSREPEPFGNDPLTLKIYAESREKALARGQLSYVADRVTTDYANLSVTSDNMRLVYVDEKRLMIYARSNLANVTDGNEAAKVTAALKLGKARFEKSKESIWQIQPDSFALDKMFLEMMLQAGLKISVVESTMLPDGTTVNGAIGTESLKLGDVGSWLSAASIDWSLIMDR
jgi:hypothetical protein